MALAISRRVWSVVTSPSTSRSCTSSGNGTSGPRNSPSGIQSCCWATVASSSSHGCHHSTRRQQQPQPDLEQPQVAHVVEQLQPASSADHPPEDDGDQPHQRTPDRRDDHHVAQGGAHLGDLALRLAPDVGVALDQLVDRRGVGLAEGDVDADPAAGALADVGQHRARVQHDVAVQRWPQHRVVGGEHQRAAAAEEDGQPRRHRDQRPDQHQHRRQGDAAPGRPGGTGHPSTIGRQWRSCAQTAAGATASAHDPDGGRG